MDNYRSMAVASVGNDDGLAALGVTPTPMAAIVPHYLNQGTRQQALSGFRTLSGR